MTDNKKPSALGATLICLFIIAYVAWVAFYLIKLRPVVLMWVFQNLGWTSFPGLLHLFLIFSPFFAVILMLQIIASISGTILGRPYK